MSHKTNFWTWAFIGAVNLPGIILPPYDWINLVNLVVFLVAWDEMWTISRMYHANRPKPKHTEQ